MTFLTKVRELKGDWRDRRGETEKIKKKDDQRGVKRLEIRNHTSSQT